MLNQFKQFLKDEDGAAAIEYALIAALIAIVIATGAKFLGGEMNNFFNTLGTEMNAIAKSL